MLRRRTGEIHAKRSRALATHARKEWYWDNASATRVKPGSRNGDWPAQRAEWRLDCPQRRRNVDYGETEDGAAGVVPEESDQWAPPNGRAGIIVLLGAEVPGENAAISTRMPPNSHKSWVTKKWMRRIEYLACTTRARGVDPSKRRAPPGGEFWRQRSTARRVTGR